MPRRPGTASAGWTQAGRLRGPPEQTDRAVRATETRCPRHRPREGPGQAGKRNMFPRGSWTERGARHESPAGWAVARPAGACGSLGKGFKPALPMVLCDCP